MNSRKRKSEVQDVVKEEEESDEVVVDKVVVKGEKAETSRKEVRRFFALIKI
jgi:hypothetical protein